MAGRVVRQGWEGWSISWRDVSRSERMVGWVPLGWDEVAGSFLVRWAFLTTGTPTQPSGGGESVADVAARGAAVFAELEAAHTDKHILLVAHGDTLSILTAVAKGTALGGHRDHAQDTGELRRLTV